jgi:hypothetical protein
MNCRDQASVPAKVDHDVDRREIVPGTAVDVVDFDVAAGNDEAVDADDVVDAAVVGVVVVVVVVDADLDQENNGVDRTAAIDFDVHNRNLWEYSDYN